MANILNKLALYVFTSMFKNNTLRIFVNNLLHLHFAILCYYQSRDTKKYSATIVLDTVRSIIRVVLINTFIKFITFRKQYLYYKDRLIKKLIKNMFNDTTIHVVVYQYLNYSKKFPNIYQ